MENSQGDRARVPAGAVVVGVDGSGPSDRAVLWAADQAGRTGRPLVLAHGVSPTVTTIWMAAPTYNLESILEAAKDSGRAALDRAWTAVHEADPSLEVHCVLERRDPRDALLGLAETAAMVVLGSRGHGPMMSLLLGSVSLAVSQHARCPVVVLRDGSGEHGRPHVGIVVGADGTPRSAAALQFAFQQAASRGLPLTVVHGYWSEQDEGLPSRARSFARADAEDMELLVAESISGLEADHPDVKVVVRVERGLANSVLLHAAEGAEMVVVGTHPTKTLYDLLAGEVSRSVLGHAHCPVAVVPDPS